MKWVPFSDRHPAPGPCYVSWSKRNVRIRVMHISKGYFDTCWFSEPKSSKESAPFFERMPTHWAEI